MPLSDPANRKLLHNRDISLRGYQRDDGLFDIEADITDSKTYQFTVGDRRQVVPGEALHHMRLRVTVDETLTIRAAEAVTEAAPFTICPGGAESFGLLAGLQIRAGFMREANARLGGAAGCTHIRELIQQVATVAIQTAYALPSRRRNDEAAAARMVNSCFSYAADGPVVKQRWPHHYTGADRAPTAPSPGPNYPTPAPDAAAGAD